MSGIGHNMPPKDEAFGMALDDAYATAKDFLDGSPIETQGQADAVGKIISEVKKLRKDADEARAEEKRPHDEAGRAVQAKWKPLLDRADTIIQAASAPLSAYLRKLAAEQEAAEAAARAEANRKAQAAIDAQRASEGNVEAIERTKVLQREAEEADKLAKRAAKAKPQVTGMDRAVGLRSHKVVTVTDHRALLLHIANTDKPALEAFLEEYARKALPAELPGCRVYIERRAA